MSISLTLAVPSRGWLSQCTNYQNCETFANECRYGAKYTGQVSYSPLDALNSALRVIYQPLAFSVWLLHFVVFGHRELYGKLFGKKKLPTKSTVEPPMIGAMKQLGD